MADTGGMQLAIQYVRDELARSQGVSFEKRAVRLLTGAEHTFNAVSSDGHTVATITNSSGLTSGGKKPVGKLKQATAELYFLSLVNASNRWLIVTNDDFLGLLQRELEGALAPGLEIRHIELPPGLRRTISSVTAEASAEFD